MNGIRARMSSPAAEPKKVKSSGLGAFSGSTPAAPRGGGPAGRRRLPVPGRYSVWSKSMVLSESVWQLSSLHSEPKSRRCPCSGRHQRAAHDAASLKLPPNRQPQGVHTCCIIVCTRDAGCSQSAQRYIVNAHVLLCCYGADTFDSLRCDGPFDAARGRDASTTTEHTHRAHRHACAQFGYAPRVADQRRRCGCCKQALGVVAPVPASAFA